MTWGEFSWADLHPERRRDRRSGRQRAVLVSGEPVPWMGFGEDSWALKVGRALPNPLDRPFFTFVLPQHPNGRRRALDDYLQPVMDVKRSTHVSLTARLTEGDNPGLKIDEAPPAFPPRIDRILAIDSPDGYCEAAAVAAAVQKADLILGSADIGVHITLRRFTRNDFDHSGNVRVIFDGLSTLLGGDLKRPADNRIRDLRLVRDSHADQLTEVRIWQIDK